MTAADVEVVAQAARIKTILEGITDVGVVHGYPRYGDAFENIVLEIAGVPLIRAWEIGIGEPGIAVDEASAGGYRYRRYPWMVRAYFSMDDEGEAGTPGYTTLLQYTGRAADALDADRNLGGTCLQHDYTQTSSPTPVFVPPGSGFLCWSATLTLEAWSLTE